MTLMKVIRDSNGTVINIGDWDYQKSEVIDDLTGERRVVKANPLPDASTEGMEEVVIGWDGGLYLFDDPRKDGSYSASVSQ